MTILKLQSKKKEQPRDDISTWNRDVSIWTCSCGGDDFYLHKNGEVECQNCALISTTMICGESR